MTDDKTETTTAPSLALQARDMSSLACYFDRPTYEQTFKVAQLMSRMSLVPKRYQGHIEDCFLALATAKALGANPLMVMGEMYVVYGTTSMSGKMVAGLVNASGIFDSPLNFRFSTEHPVTWCEAYTTLKGQEYKVCVRWTEDVVTSGWDRDKKEKETGATIPSKWKSMREQMFRYRSASWFAKAFCPQVLLGMQTREEVEDEHAGEPVPVEVISDPKVEQASKLASQAAALDAAAAAEKVKPEKHIKVVDKTEPVPPPDDDRMGPVDEGKPTTSTGQVSVPDLIEEAYGKGVMPDALGKFLASIKLDRTDKRTWTHERVLKLVDYVDGLGEAERQPEDE